jgi:hypothetical protein
MNSIDAMRVTDHQRDPSASHRTGYLPDALLLILSIG